MKEYEVVNVEMSGSSGSNIDKIDLKTKLNSYASKGWQFVSITSDTWDGYTNNTYVIFERDII